MNHNPEAPKYTTDQAPAPKKPHKPGLVRGMVALGVTAIPGLLNLNPASAEPGPNDVPVDVGGLQDFSSAETELTTPIFDKGVDALGDDKYEAQSIAPERSDWAGIDRRATAVEVSEANFEAQSAGGVTLVSDDNLNWADSVTGTAVSAGIGPLLLVNKHPIPGNPGFVDKRVIEEIRRVMDPRGNVTIVGGLGAVPAAAKQHLEQLGFEVRQYGGNNRYDTAAFMADGWGGLVDYVVVTDGSARDVRNAPVGLVAGFLAANSYRPQTNARITAPLLLTNGAAIPPETQAYLDRHPNVKILAVGNAAADAFRGRSFHEFRADDSKSPEDQAADISVAVARYAPSHTLSEEPTWMANASRGRRRIVFVSKGPDGLAAGRGATVGNDSALIFVRRDGLTDSNISFINEVKGEVGEAIFVGGDAAFANTNKDDISRRLGVAA